MKAKSMQISDMRASRREAGLCVQCGERPPEEEKVRCSSCLEVNRARYAAGPRRLPARPAECPDCGGPSKWKEVTVLFRQRRRFEAERCASCVAKRTRERFRANTRQQCL